ncbi:MULTISPECIES: XdhC family protein [Methylosinus]|uniref:XdhC/CoxI family protein n=1 Tax=Methylosinus trichosporium (strain ATCC 35070 / NCIMB 11131 / UNIQEM 75 / OB3b) TaxID=595536 RepID=A0A2D2D6R3_METT3|nr:MULTISPECIES: XdhC/CoxI family protein [Methylosinus]ATQ70663.1 XdhC/CoxI family protein [Methylosinus trichosporium OB3b]OBS52844.1 XdhC/CoxI family protein [Methylosinus sp. 3S-1]
MATEDTKILLQAQLWRRTGRRVAIATVIETFGSAPRPVGAHLVVDETGAFVGSVSAGCVENDVIVAALDVIADGVAQRLEFGVADETAWRVGLSCGGRICVLVQKLDDAAAELLDVSLRMSTERRAHTIATPLDNGVARVIETGDPLAAFAGWSGVATHEAQRWFIEGREPAPRLVIIGAVHVAQSLAPMAQIAGFETIIVDPRIAYATADRFPDARLEPRWPQEALTDIGLDPCTAIVVLTHDPKIDDPALRTALASPCFYVGALGSRATHGRRVERLAASGVSRDALMRIRAPVGLDIGALGPAEIAVSILGEMILARKRKPLRSSAAVKEVA